MKKICKVVFVLGLVLAELALSLDAGRLYGDWKEDESPEKWNKYAENRIKHLLNQKMNLNVAKNVILFIGDGMGISTVTAGRIRKGQFKNKSGEEEVTNMESLDHAALVKTYNIDAQTPDSAATATAFLCGVKTRYAAVGVDGRAFDCKSSLNAKVDSIMKWAHAAGKSTGIVTTTRVTHATPSAAYANSYYRNLEAYDDVKFTKKHKDEGCKDIAAQLVEDNYFINVIFAGGRRKFMRKTDQDYKLAKRGDRVDGRNLIDEWNRAMTQANISHKFVWNISEFEQLKPSQYDHILGLLAFDHMAYENERNAKPIPDEPKITDMTSKAIDLLSTNPNGYVLLVEGGKIDHGHHNSNARKALDDFVAFDEAVGVGLEKTSSEDTLIIVTADHSHEFYFGGYGKRGNPILGILDSIDEDSSLNVFNLTQTVVGYGNGPGGLIKIRTHNLTDEMTESKDYTQESVNRLDSETHGGEDVAAFARGPLSYLIAGTIEQSFVAHAIGYSSCIGPYRNDECRKKRGGSKEPDHVHMCPTAHANANRIRSGSTTAAIISAVILMKLI